MVHARADANEPWLLQGPVAEQILTVVQQKGYWNKLPMNPRINCKTVVLNAAKLDPIWVEQVALTPQKKQACLILFRLGWRRRRGTDNTALLPGCSRSQDHTSTGPALSPSSCPAAPTASSDLLGFTDSSVLWRSCARISMEKMGRESKAVQAAMDTIPASCTPMIFAAPPRKTPPSDLKKATANTPQAPQAPCTAKASRGSSMRRRRTAADAAR